MPRKRKVFNLDEVARKTKEVLASQPPHKQIMDAAAVASGTPSQQIEEMPETEKVFSVHKETGEIFDECLVLGVAAQPKTVETVIYEKKDDKKEDDPPRKKTDWTLIIGQLRTLEDVQAKLMELTTNTRCPSKILKRLQLAAKALIEMKKSSKGDEKSIPVAKVKNMLRALKKAYCEAWASNAGFAASIRIIDRIQEYCGKSIRVQYPEIDKACLAFICECGNEIVTPKCEAECLAMEAALERL